MNEFETEKIQMKKENEVIKREKEILQEKLKNLEVKLVLENEKIYNYDNCFNLVCNQIQELERHKMKIDSIFKPNYNEQEKGENNFIKELVDNAKDNSKRIETYQIVSDEVMYEDFICIVCLELTNNLNCCAFCDKTSCLECKIKLNDICPYCRSQPYITRGFTRNEKKTFNNIKIKCPNDCGEISSNENYKSHLNSCIKRIKTFICNYCKNIIEAPASNQEFINDHMKICSKNCNFCQKNYSLMDFNKHESICLDRIINSLKKIIEKSKENPHP